MQKTRFPMLLLSLVILTLIAAGCSSDADKKALKDEQGKVVALDHKNSPSLVFFFTGNGWDYCKSQLVELQKNKKLFANFPGDVYALSADPVENHKKLKEELGLQYPLLSDYYLQVIEKAGLKDPEAPKALRGFAILDPDGKVIEAYQVDPFGEEAANIISYASDKVKQAK